MLVFIGFACLLIIGLIVSDLVFRWWLNKTIQNKEHKLYNFALFVKHIREGN